MERVFAGASVLVLLGCIYLLADTHFNFGDEGHYTLEFNGTSTKTTDWGGGIEHGVQTLNDSTLSVYRVVAGDTIYCLYFRFDPHQQNEAFNAAQLASGLEYLNPGARAEYMANAHLLRPISRKAALP